LHRTMGRQMVETGCAALVIACGEHARDVVAGARAAGMPKARTICCRSVDDALPYLDAAILPGDAVLVKGSRTMKMERVVEAIDRALPCVPGLREPGNYPPSLGKSNNSPTLAASGSAASAGASRQGL
jgi:hypothetical protein